MTLTGFLRGVGRCVWGVLKWALGVAWKAVVFISKATVALAKWGARHPIAAMVIATVMYYGGKWLQLQDSGVLQVIGIILARASSPLGIGAAIGFILKPGRAAEVAGMVYAVLEVITEIFTRAWYEFDELMRRIFQKTFIVGKGVLI